MKQLYSKTAFYTLPYLVFLLGSGFVLFIFEKGQIHLFINQFHSGFWDVFFKLFTNVGDGLTPVFFSVLLLFFSVRKAFLLGLSTALAGILSQFFKKLIFPMAERPKAFFENIADLYFVPGIDIHSAHSFPSGHTATAFCMFFIFAYITKNKWLQLLFFICALLVGFSRMYLSQHFLTDVYFGSVIGVASAVLIIYLLGRSEKLWLDKSIVIILSNTNEKKH